MIEVNEIRKVVNPCPAERHASAPTLANRFKIWTVRKEFGVAIHANFSRGDPCKRRSFHRDVAISTIDAVIIDMMFVAELDRLPPWNISSCRIGRAREGRQEPKPCTSEEYRSENDYLENRVCTGMKCLGHAVVSSLQRKRYPAFRYRTRRAEYLFPLTSQQTVQLPRFTHTHQPFPGKTRNPPAR